MTTFNRVEQLTKVQNEALELFKKKNHDYGDAFADYDVVGVLVRLGDKVKRCQSISKLNYNTIHAVIFDTSSSIHSITQVYFSFLSIFFSSSYDIIIIIIF